MSVQTALSVGDPVKNLETSELKELVALNPMMMSAMPPTSSAREMILLIMAFRCGGAFFFDPHQAARPP
jgi:hypothetical protein